MRYINTGISKMNYPGRYILYVWIVVLNHISLHHMSHLPYLHTLQPLCGVSPAFCVCTQTSLCEAAAVLKLSLKLHSWYEKKGGYLTKRQMCKLKAVFLLPRGMAFLEKSWRSTAHARGGWRSSCRHYYRESFNNKLLSYSSHNEWKSAFSRRDSDEKATEESTKTTINNQRMDMKRNWCPISACDFSFLGFCFKIFKHAFQLCVRE